MDAVDLGSVMEFLSKHGLSNTELALEEDMKQKEAGAYDLENFLFVLPPLRISSGFSSPWRSMRKEIIGRDTGFGSDTDDEFVSLVSSSENDCSSEFINPYGNRSSPANSSSSSDRLSQFATAREYPDFEFKNSLVWYDEKEDSHFLTPCFSGQDFFDNISEDKFALKLESENAICAFDESDGHEMDSGVDYLDKPCLADAEFTISRLFPDSLDDHHHGKDYSLTNLPLKTDSLPEEAGHAEERNSNADEAEEPSVDEILLTSNEDDDFEIFNLPILHRKNRTGFEEVKEFPIVVNSIIAGRYYVKEYLGSAAFSRVIKACDLHTGIDVCLKIIKNDKDFFDQSLDEIKLLKMVNFHDPSDERHLLRLYDYFYHQEHLFIVCELLKANLHEFQKYNQESGDEPYFTGARLQIITRQCLEALEYLHQLGIIHCDLKPENILMKSYTRCEIKVIDLGSSCFQSDNLCSYVQSRSYRAPEVILGLPYDGKIDMWSLGCILAELSTGEVLFPNHPVVTILSRIIGMFGAIDSDMLATGEETFKYFSEEYDLCCFNEMTNEVEHVIPESLELEEVLQSSDGKFVHFVRWLLEVNPSRRPSASEALRHPWLSYAMESS